ncbi:low-density lipoprotein receptor-related protein 4-like [Haliotis asinina]|uniref:low-density lipoprotein receptor-related protein 4-like n=1 Tax=Haliotis asinina TaxID=109174 RepID=UPI003531DF5F
MVTGAFTIAAIGIFILFPHGKDAATNKAGVNFECTNGRTILLQWRCDEENDCGDNSDESNCSKRTCAANEFPCLNEKCIPNRWTCDKENDCGDNSDEADDVCGRKTCDPDMFACNNGQCITSAWVCDGAADCPGSDKEDEMNCCRKTCDPDMFACNNGQCITSAWVCDGAADCPGSDKEDEMNCYRKTCDPDMFACNNGQCITSARVCDGAADCPGSDKEDETNCSVTCKKGEFTCDNGQCISQKWKCDGDKDCEDGSDEDNCESSPTCAANTFTCLDGTCVHKTWWCDGDMDCPDYSDEANCTDACDGGEIMCLDGRDCVPRSLQCDGTYDCQDGSDERNCTVIAVDPCSNNNGGCEQICVSLSGNTSKCDCNPGYSLTNDSQTVCTDIDECQDNPIHGTCSQICKNTKGSYKCECVANYSLVNRRYCKARGGHPELLLATRRDLRRIDLETLQMRLVLGDAFVSSAVALDFDFLENKMYWTDVGKEGIFSVDLDNKSSVEGVASTDVRSPDGLAVDWINKHLYWTDTGLDRIEISSLNGKMRKTLIDSGLDEPRAIVLDPNHGLMYWTDWGKEPKIERCGMDGSDRKVIVNTSIAWPNGLTIDYIANRLYWVDSKLHIIESSNMFGLERVSVLQSVLHLRNPFAITVFEDFLYWSDWHSESVKKYSKFGRRSDEKVETIVMNIYSPMGVRVFHPYRQQIIRRLCGDNNGGCSHFCLPKAYDPSISELFVCDCPNGLILSSDRKTCVEGVIAVDPCSNNNGGCEQICVSLSGNTSKCDCNPGYSLTNDSQTVCTDIDECQDNPIHGTCSQICKNTKGSYKCECVNNYSLVNRRYCKASGGHPELLLATRKDLRRIDLETLQMRLVLGDADVSSAVALDFDFLENKMYWTDVAKEGIFSVDLDNKSSVEGVASTDVRSPDGLAVDWINKHLYWTDTGLDRIEISSLNGKMRKTLIDSGLDEPRAIVLDPNHGLMYWTDWGKEPKIERCGMDGSDRKVIVNTSIAWPNGLTIDYIANRLYWVDSKLHIIESSNMFGLERVSVLQSVLHLRNPFAVTVFEDFLYWSDWHSESVKKYSKFGRRSDEEVETIVTNIYSPMGVRVFHPYRQQIIRRLCGDNNGGCSHFCLPKAYDPSISELFVCDCPNGLILSSDRKTCVDGVIAVDPCSNNNGGCEQICVSLSGNTSKCDCNPGYSLTNDSQTVCTDIDECQDNPIHGTCSQICKNTKGSYKCECVNNYSLVNRRYCKANSGHPELLLATRSDLRRIDLETLQMRLVLGDAYVSPAVAVDFDFLENKVYWTDVAKGGIFSVDLDNKSSVEGVASTDVRSPDGLAVDWINKHLYWTDTGLDRIEISSLNGKMRKTLIDSGLDEPRAIVLDPNHGLMFWTDWGKEPKIERCGMDGSDRKVIVNTSIAWPNGLTIDYIANRLYWVDSKLRIIESSNMLGLERVSVLQSVLHLHSPFAITVFEDFLYWSDWYSESVKKYSKFGRRSDEEVETIVTNIYSPMGVRVFHPYRQQIIRRLCGDNNGGCSHFCLPKAYDPSISELFVCDCPNGLVLSSDRKTCVDGGTYISTNMCVLKRSVSSFRGSQLQYKIDTSDCHIKSTHHVTTSDGQIKWTRQIDTSDRHIMSPH